VASPVELVLSVARNLVAKPDEARAVWREAERTVEITVAPEDRGKIIGRRGKTIDSLRVLINTAFGEENKRLDIRLVED